MSKLNDLTAITTPSLSDLVYCVQNSTDYKVTNQQLLDLIKTNTVIPLTQAQYDLLTPAEKNNGSIYIITDASITADDVEYSSGVSVGDKLDGLNAEYFSLTYSSSITDLYIRSEACYYIPATKEVHISFMIYSASGQIPVAGNAIANIPSNYRPSTNRPLGCFANVIKTGSGYQPWVEGLSDIGTDGNIKLANWIYGNTPTQIVGVSFSYIK